MCCVDTSWITTTNLSMDLHLWLLLTSLTPQQSTAATINTALTVTNTPASAPVASNTNTTDALAP